MRGKKTTIAAATAAALLAAAPGMTVQASPTEASAHSAEMPCVLSGVMAAANISGSRSIVPAQAAICEKGPDERGWFFCQGFMLYRW